MSAHKEATYIYDNLSKWNKSAPQMISLTHKKGVYKLYLSLSVGGKKIIKMK